MKAPCCWNLRKGSPTGVAKVPEKFVALYIGISNKMTIYLCFLFQWRDDCQQLYEVARNL
jgi:hypothetical protein